MSDLDKAYEKYVLNKEKKKTLALEENEIERCTIDVNTRIITVTDSLKIAGVMADNNVKRIFFKTNKEAQIIDLSQLEVHINYLNANGEADKYHVTDKKVEGDYITFSWLISDFATRYKGEIKFIVCMENENGEHWNSTIATLEVLEGLETDEAIIEQNPDVLEDVLKRLEGIEFESNIEEITTEELENLFIE